MKIREAFLLAVLLLFNEVQANQNGASLNSLIQELAPIARLTNGIAIQTELSKDSNKMNELVAEFLGVGSGDDVARLKQLKVDEVAKELGELYATVEKVPELNVDMAALANSFKALETMKQGSAVLDNKNLTDPSDELNTTISDAKRVTQSSFTSFKDFENVITGLELIKNTHVDKVKGDFQNKQMIPLRESIDRVLIQLDVLNEFDRKLKPVFELEGMSAQLEEFTEMSTISQLFQENFNTFFSMATTLSELGNNVNDLKPVLAKEDALIGLAKDLGNSSAFVKKLMNSPSTLKLTVGFSGGIDDLKLILDDLKKPTVKKLISGGKDTKGFEEALGSVANLHSTFQSLHKVWSEVAQSKKVDASGDLAADLASIFGNSYKPIDATKLADSLNSIGQCFEDLKRPAGIIDYTKVASLIKYAADLGQRIKTLRTFMELKESAFQTLPANLSTLKDFITPILTDEAIGVAISAYKNVQNFSDIDSVIDSLDDILDESEKVQDPFSTLQKAVNLTVITAVLDSLNGTNVDGMLACLQKNSYNSAELDSTLSFSKNVQDIKKKKTEVESVKSFLTYLTLMKTRLLEVQKETASAQKPKPRRRRAPNQKTLANLKTTVATDFGRGVQVLREFTKILENEASVKVAVEADDGLKKAISAIPGVQSVWTDDNRKGMGKMVVDLNDLDKYALTLKKNNMTSLWMIFDEAQKIQGVEIADAKVFEDPISIALAVNSDPKIKGTSGDFKNLGALELNFAQHTNHLKAAALTLQPLQQFFDDIFGNSKPSGVTGIQTVTVKTSDSTTLIIILSVIGGILLLAAIGTVGWLLWKRHKRILKERELEKLLKENRDKKWKYEDKKWENRERYWIYEDFYDLDNAVTNPVLAVHDGRFNNLKALIKKGALLDVYRDGMTPLHWAVENASPKFAELLIRAGADRSLISDDNKTPEQMLEKCLTQEKYKESWAKLKAVKAVFKKYEDRKFRPKIRDLLPLSEFNIQLMVNDEKMKDTVKQFQEKFDQNLKKDATGKPTHIVFDTDKDGVFDFDTLPKNEETDRDNIQYYLAILNGTVAVKSSWLVECLKGRENMRTDYEHRITKIRINGKVFETLDEWKKWMNRRWLPCLFNVEFFYCWYGVDPQPNAIELFRQLIQSLGGTFMDEPQMFSETARPTTPRPFWHQAMQQRWIVYHPKCHKFLLGELDGKELRTPSLIGVEYEIKSVKEFFEFLFSMNGWKDLKPPPPTIESTMTAVIGTTSSATSSAQTSKNAQK